MDAKRKTAPDPGPDVSSGRNHDSSSSLFNLKDPFLTGLLFSVIVVFLTIMYFYIRNKKRGRSILIVGPTEAGKTKLFVRLGFDNENEVETVTSTTANIAEYSVSDKAPLILKDLPGHEKVRSKFWDENKVGMRGIICVLDASGGSKAVRDAAEVLYDVLTDPLVNSVKPDVLIFANKQDLPTAKGTKVLRLHLERELTTLRLTKSASLQTTGGNTNESSKVLGKPDRDFEFDQLLPIKITFAEGVANGGKDSEPGDLKQVNEWLNLIA